jgi:hypothetical protein
MLQLGWWKAVGAQAQKKQASWTGAVKPQGLNNPGSEHALRALKVRQTGVNWGQREAMDIHPSWWKLLEGEKKHFQGADGLGTW